MRTIRRTVALLILLLGFVARAWADDSQIIVAADGSGAFKTVQSAIDSIPDNNNQPRVILIKPGTYKERIIIPKNKPQLTLRGDEKDASKTILTFNRHSGMDDPDAPGKKVGTSGSESLLILPDQVTCENLTVENSAGDIGQAVAVRTMGDKIAFYNCRLLGWQDTLYVNGARTYFGNCYIEGRTDFIFGRATAVFENCETHSKNGGFVTAASTNPKSPYGLVFLNCKITGEGAALAYLGRPWKEGSAAAFIKCEIGDHIQPAGWSEWKGNENHKTARYVEYQCTGPGADRSQRPDWTKELSDDDAKKMTVQNILGGTDQWDPTHQEK